MAESNTPNPAAGQELSETERMVQEALAEAQQSIDQMKSEADSASPMQMPDLGGGAGGATATSLELLSDVDLHVTIELGRTQMLVEDVLKLGEGSVVELDKLAGDPVDVYVNQRLVARGEVLVLNDNFCIRISEIVANLEEQAEAAAEEEAQAG